MATDHTMVNTITKVTLDMAQDIKTTTTLALIHTAKGAMGILILKEESTKGSEDHGRSNTIQEDKGKSEMLKA